MQRTASWLSTTTVIDLGSTTSTAGKTGQDKRCVDSGRLMRARVVILFRIDLVDRLEADLTTGQMQQKVTDAAQGAAEHCFHDEFLLSASLYRKSAGELRGYAVAGWIISRLQYAP
jgi:hypothetical protein